MFGIHFVLSGQGGQKLPSRTEPLPRLIDSDGNVAKSDGDLAEIARQFFPKLKEGKTKEPQSLIAECLQRQDIACETVARASDLLERCDIEIEMRRTKPSARGEDGIPA